MKKPVAGSTQKISSSIAPANKILIIACGALAREILHIVEKNQLRHIELKCLPASIHNEPERIPEAVRDAIHKYKSHYGRILIGFGDCGTGGLLDKVLHEEGVERIGGAHCYAFYTGVQEFESLEEEDIGTFYLTDFLARQFDSMVFRPLGLDRYPDLRDTYFSHYNRVVYLAQTKDDELERRAVEAAKKLNLPLVKKFVGYGELDSFITAA